MANIIDFDEEYGIAVSQGKRNVALSIAPAEALKKHEIGSSIGDIEDATHIFFRSAEQIDGFIAILAQAKRNYEGARDED